MTGATRFVWAAAGRPGLDGRPVAAHVVDGDAACVMCGEDVTESAPASRGLANGFTDHYSLARPDSDRICPACLWVTTGKPPATLRMWSLVVAPGVDLPASQPKAWLQVPGLCLTNRADPSPVLSCLLDPPAGEWLVTIAVSAQKHVVPWAHVNRGGGGWVVRMEEVDVAGDPATFGVVLGHAASLRAQGHTADQVRALTPNLSKLRTRSDLDTWTLHASPLTQWRESPLIDLALWCLVKGNIHDYAHPAPTGSDRSDDNLAGRSAQLRLC